MKKLTPINIAGLHHAEFGQMMVRFFEDFSKTDLKTADDADFESLYNALESALPTFNSALDQVRASEESKEIARLDFVRDAALQSLRDSLKPYRNAKDEEESAAYNALSILLSEYKGTEDDSLEAETNKLNTLTTRLGSEDYIDRTDALDIKKFVTRLGEANTNFNNLFAQRSYKTSQKEVYDVKALRKAMTADYKKMANYIAAIANVKESGYYPDVLAVINNGRTYFSSVVLSRRKGKNPPPPAP
ncbi:DUF6261 family protein [Frigoriflavimonas asaccharolytica]|uniref:Uncharacterized protein n=1 Tax=Frigoriflavimonas asaccharolytica TaxID=2735899 RepID=A0A8J8G4Y2_9FLAO|nr:DUF6261 family protein [Frigoriflavimonas asaccharolytica]NRS91376.1 hypothetical protein [Frigoriflavimonas asaccharolytica]